MEADKRFFRRRKSPKSSSRVWKLRGSAKRGIDFSGLCEIGVELEAVALPGSGMRLALCTKECFINSF
jgi:hypothetical protein